MTLASPFPPLLALAALLLTPGRPASTAHFVTAGIALLGAGLLGLVVAGWSRRGAYRLAVGVTVAASLLLVWGNLAVGFIGSEDNPANLLYAAVLVVGFVGAAVARLRPLGMARALLATALAQFAVPFVALLIWRPALNMGVVWVLVLNTLFAGLWVAAARLFRRAAAPGSPTSPRLA
ncbi:hypothetical protein [Hymenobacter chitinivorans]|uniref:Uncharacterized protein n=1 Tax=Hymenobacter chitinivorans DSM 11115 TaxID=1121954 RepID=A0A2M9BKX7_9BACT|nr:hypothetical protein [Hymenobacter chitinivorans]PJJ58604.1 hypothetical protein CLV45_0014 [Hymenobacter chitinivorans DSM 11115]